MLPLEVAAAHRAGLRAVAATVVAAGRAQWARVDPARLDDTYPAARLLAVLTGGQLAAASQAEPYTRRVLAAQGVDAPAVGRVNPRGFAGSAADGRDLRTLLAEPVIAAKAASAAGGSSADVSAAGLASLMRILVSETIDAGRTADGVGIAARPRVTGYVRMLTPPSCSRCAVLGGKWYRWNTGFQRHPRCDCVHIPASEDASGDLRTDPMATIRGGQVTGLSRADTRAILEDGADPYQVINAHRGMYTAGGRKFTTEGVTSRGLAGQRLGDLAKRGGRYRSSGISRLRPEQIYRDATSREDAIRLLRRFGYVI